MFNMRPVPSDRDEHAPIDGRCLQSGPIVSLVPTPFAVLESYIVNGKPVIVGALPRFRFGRFFDVEQVVLTFRIAETFERQE